MSEELPGAERVADVLGDPFTAETLRLADDDEGEVVATLVHRPAVDGARRGAMLHVHGFADYFFHVEYATWWAERGYDVYALDLRKYGRSLRPHHTPNYVDDLWQYFAEIDEAWRRVVVRDGHRRVVLSGHTTGGLTVSLWANARRPSALAGVVLNSPWFDMQGPAWRRSPAMSLALREVGRRTPRRVIPRTVSGLYARSLHRDHEGEFDFDLSWKPVASYPTHAAWLSAIRAGHARLHRGLHIDRPILVLTSSGSADPREMGPEVHTRDIVLDVSQIRRWSPNLGPHLTLVSIPDARHDVVLSLPPVRAHAYDELARWHDAYLGDCAHPPPGRDHLS